MGCKNSVQSTPKEGPNVELERDLLKQRLESLFNFKVLLLGAGESGKSTIVKQFRLIHNKKLDKRELEATAVSLHQNVIDCVKSLLGAASKFKYEIEDSDKKTAEQINTFEENSRISVEMAHAILKLWESSPIRKAWMRRSEYWILDACQFYMDNLLRFVESDFVPTEEDQLRARVRTTGIVVTNLEQKIPDPKPDEPEFIRFQVVDVGGQRNERKKWIHCFDDVKAILFIVNLNGYDQVLFEDNTKNRMVESFELFHEITNKPIFKETPIILFLNKKDLFESLIRERDLIDVRDNEGKQIFGDYKGQKHNVLDALDYLKARFQKELPPGKNVDVQIVTGVVKADIRAAFGDVKKTLVDSNRKLIEKEKQLIIKEERRVGQSRPCACTCCC